MMAGERHDRARHGLGSLPGRSRNRGMPGTEDCFLPSWRSSCPHAGVGDRCLQVPVWGYSSCLPVKCAENLALVWVVWSRWRCRTNERCQLLIWHLLALVAPVSRTPISPLHGRRVGEIAGEDGPVSEAVAFLSCLRPPVLGRCDELRHEQRGVDSPHATCQVVALHCVEP